MKQNKILAMVLTLAMAVSLSACGNAGQSANADVTESEMVQTEIPETENVTETEGEEAVDDKVSTDAEEPKVEVPGFDTTQTIEETVLVDESDVKITATGLTYTNSAAELGLLIENNSDKNLSFVTGSVGYSPSAVNGYMVSGYMNADVAAGKKANEIIRFNLDELLVHGITQIADIRVGFEVTDEDYESFKTATGQVKTSAADTYDYETDTYVSAVKGGVLETIYNCKVDYFAEENLYAEGDVSVVSQAVITNQDGEKAIFLEMVNDTEESVLLAECNLYLNNLAVRGGRWGTERISAHSRKVIQIAFDSLLETAYWETFGLTEVGEFSMELNLLDDKFNDITEPKHMVMTFANPVPTVDVSGTEVYNENGVRIIYKGIVKDSFDLSDDLHLMMLVENNSDQTLAAKIVYDSLSLNGFMVDSYYYDRDVEPGKCGIMDITLYHDSLTENGITAPEDITEAEMALEIKDDSYNTIAEATVKVPVE